MALKTLVSVEIEKNGNKFVFCMPVGVKLQDCYDASVEVSKEIVDLSKKIEDQKKEKEAAVEEEKKDDNADSNIEADKVDID